MAAQNDSGATVFRGLLSQKNADGLIGDVSGQGNETEAYDADTKEWAYPLFLKRRTAT